MFFELHNENRIGYKKLSAADLGISPSSHQTHIGLSEFVLTYLSNRDAISENSIFIYQDRFNYIDAYFDRIENPDGTFRSPKIRVGERGCVSIVSTIRSIAKLSDTNYNWFLIWFGLKNSKIVFYLFNDHSIDYRDLNALGINFNISGTHYFDSSNSLFLTLMQQIEQKVNSNGEEIVKELEIITQIEDIPLDKKYKTYDIEKANENIKRTGREGEEFVNNYLSKLKSLGQILNFEWFNKETESGLPYDFSIQDNRNNIIYLDVKSTGFDFEQKMIFSSQEINFIATTRFTYCIYRVYKNNNGDYSLRICENFKRFSESINYHTNSYSTILDSIQVGFKSAKFAISPTLHLFKFNPEVSL